MQILYINLVGRHPPLDFSAFDLLIKIHTQRFHAATSAHSISSNNLPDGPRDICGDGRK